MRVMWMMEVVAIMLGISLHPMLLRRIVVRGEHVPTTYLITRTHPVHSHTVIHPIRSGHLVEDNASQKQSPQVVHYAVVEEASAATVADEANGNATGGSEGTAKKGTKSSGHKSTNDEFETSSGDQVNEGHTVESADSGEKDTEQHDSDHDEGFHEDGAKGGFGHRTSSGDKEARRSFEKGFFKQYHKKESHKLHEFFGNEHKGGEYHRYGKSNTGHASASSGSGKGEHSKAATVEKQEASKKSTKS